MRARLGAVVLACFLALSARASAQPAHPQGDTSAHELGEEHEGAEPKDMNWFDTSNKKQPPYIAALFNFALLLFIYYRFGKKPVMDALKNRRAAIAKEIEDAQRMKNEAKGRAKKYQAKLAGLGDELEATKQGLLDAGKADQERIVREAEEKAARMRKDAAFMLDQEVRQMKLDLVKETVDVAIAAAEELLKKRVTQADQDRLAEEFLAQLASRSKKSLAPPAAPRGEA